MNEDQTVKECTACDGTGTEPWHLGCEDNPPPICHSCDGMGEVYLVSEIGGER